MATIESPAQSRAVMDVLGAAENALGTADPVSLTRALGAAARSLPMHPVETANALLRLLIGHGSAWLAALRLLVGDPAEGPAVPAASDKRFNDAAFAANPVYFWLAQNHLLTEQFSLELLDVAGLDPEQDRKARFAAKFLLDAMAPTNTLPGNPAAVRTAFETGGKSVVNGMRNMFDDMVNNGGWPKQVDSSPFEVGVNMAATKGKVVFRSDLIELIQYQPQTSQVYEIPLLFCPPWINKYYIMDLAPGKSLIEWAVQHGHTCFVISYRNPDESMRDVTFEDYLMRGPIDAIDVVRDITGSDVVNTVSVCLGGTLTAIALAYEAREGRKSINAATLLNSHTDFTITGLLGAFTDESTIAGLEKRMEKVGYLEAKDMARTFDALRANDLIFAYVVNNWLMGKQPPAFDLLAWNNDSTRMPAKMHSRYLRSCFLDNEFALGRFVVAGETVDPAKADADMYVLSAVEDHIVPWKSAYKTTQLLGGRHRYVLSTSGHIAGIVNPPNPKAKHWTNETLGPDPDRWLAGATLHEETWWEDWARWMDERSGPQQPAPRELGSRAYPPLEDAPGTYVRTRA
ncbi:MAG: PHA/PHB synthase family protein [Acidimicrobiia bacterium]